LTRQEFNRAAGTSARECTLRHSDNRFKLKFTSSPRPPCLSDEFRSKLVKPFHRRGAESAETPR